MNFRFMSRSSFSSIRSKLRSTTAVARVLSSRQSRIVKTDVWWVPEYLTSSSRLADFDGPDNSRRQARFENGAKLTRECRAKEIGVLVREIRREMVGSRRHPPALRRSVNKTCPRSLVWGTVPPGDCPLAIYHVEDSGNVEIQDATPDPASRYAGIAVLQFHYLPSSCTSRYAMGLPRGRILSVDG